ncbi:MAG: pyridine nucleotide-disulfide oxidoreductase, partial [Actinomycetota bacterium]|nr:pyridine nucleotide-disulfide oxidoreductase [Actinomycetota bacterium]
TTGVCICSGDLDVDVVGKFMGVVGTRAQFSGSLNNLVANADLKQNRLLERIDDYAADHGLDAELLDKSRPRPTELGKVPTEVDLDRFATIVWATGYRPKFRWLDQVAFDNKGRIIHDGGVCAVPGLYVLGLPFLRRRKSSFIDGVGPDAADLASHLYAYLDRRIRC